VAVDGARIVPPEGPFPLTLELGPGEIRPGLINAHDHLHRNHYPRLGRPPYPDAYAWGRDIHERDAEVIARARAVDRRDALLFGALKNLLSGVTTVVHHDPWERIFEEDFPVRVPRVRTVHSLGIEPERAADEGRALRSAGGGPVFPLCIHLAEGTTSETADEVREAERLGLLGPVLLAVHAVGADSSGVALLAARGAAVVWCPSSNDFLLGRTASRELLARVDVLLGSDSLLTGVGDFLDELRFARGLGLVEERKILASVGEVAARRLGLPPPSLAPGAPADLIVLRRPLLEATARDIDLVIVAGMPRVADERYAEVFDLAGMRTERVRVGGATRLVPSPLGSVAERILADWPDAIRAFACSHAGHRA